MWSEVSTDTTLIKWSSGSDCLWKTRSIIWPDLWVGSRTHCSKSNCVMMSSYGSFCAHSHTETWSLQGQSSFLSKYCNKTEMQETGKWTASQRAFFFLLGGKPVQMEEVELHVLKRQSQFKQLKWAVIKSKRISNSSRRHKGSTENDSRTSTACCARYG